MILLWKQEMHSFVKQPQPWKYIAILLLKPLQIQQKTTTHEIVGADSEGALEKAIFYRNSIKQESGVEQGYNFNVSLEIQELGTINSLRIEEHDQEFVDAEGNRYSTNVDGVNYIYTTMFAMSKQNFEMIFGTEGYVQVYDKKGTLLGTINKNSPLDENGFYYINLPEKTGPVVSITSKPIVISGTYTYIAHRDISPDMPYTKAEISTFQNLAEGFTNTSRKDGESDYTGGGSAEAMLPLVEPLSQSTISISKQSLEVGKVNENVILTITVKNGAPAKFEWYARPIFDIELPKEPDEKHKKLNAALEQLNNRYGKGAVVKGTFYRPDRNKKKDENQKR